MFARPDCLQHTHSDVNTRLRVLTPTHASPHACTDLGSAMCIGCSCTALASKAHMHTTVACSTREILSVCLPVACVGFHCDSARSTCIPPSKNANGKMDKGKMEKPCDMNEGGRDWSHKQDGFSKVDLKSCSLSRSPAPSCVVHCLESHTVKGRK